MLFNGKMEIYPMTKSAISQT